MRTYSLEPKDLGIPRCEIKDLAGGDAAHNANLLMVATLSGVSVLLQSCLVISIYLQTSSLVSNVEMCP